MFRILVSTGVGVQLKKMKRVDSSSILRAIETHLRHEPERTSRSRIKRLRGVQTATYRLRVDEFRVFYDVSKGQVTVTAVLHKRDSAQFYQGEK